VELQSRLGELKAKGIGLAAVSYDPPSILADFAQRRGITFPLLSDHDSRIIKSYGILNTTIAPTAAYGGLAVYGVPFPGTFILNRKGVVTARHFEDILTERATASSIFIGLGDLGGTSAVRHTTDHLEITTSVSDETISAGTVFSLVLDIKPMKRIHVYAPGVTGYKPIALRLEPVPGLKLRPMRFPASEIYHFLPLKERVPVYQKAFRLVQELNVDLSRDGQALLRDSERLTIKGSFDYQACDDKICFQPTSVPVEWAVKVRKLDSERSKVAR
jgi:hypothetical protein